MKKLFLLMALASGAQGPLLAQKVFELPNGYVNREFYFEYPGGNEVQLRLGSIRDLFQIHNLDSTFRICMEDLSSLRDSLSDELTLKFVDYAVDSAGRRLIRLRRTPAPALGFIVQHGSLSALKLQQDTLHLILPVGQERRRFEIYVFVNDMTELPALLSGGLNGKLDTLKRASYAPDLNMPRNFDWEVGSNRRLHLQSNPDISENQMDGNIQPNHDQIGFEADAMLSNYKDYFVPAFFLGVKVQFNSSTDLLHKNSPFKYFLALGWEPQFFFQGSTGQLKTYRNDMLTLYFARERKTPIERPLVSRPHFGFNPDLSIGYVINQVGSFYEPHTFRVGLGSIHLGGGDAIQVQPVIYFNNFFKGVTPGVSVTIGF